MNGKAMKRLVSVGLLVALSALVSRPGVPSAAIRASAAAPVLDPAASRPMLDKYCVTCHSARTKAGNLILEHAALDRVPEDAETWEKVIRKLRTGSMPPIGMPRPDEASVT